MTFQLWLWLNTTNHVPIVFVLVDFLSYNINHVLVTAARVLIGKTERDPISPTLVSLHWLHVKKFKILLFTYKALNV